jgi:hypothetical protein
MPVDKEGSKSDSFERGEFPLVTQPLTEDVRNTHMIYQTMTRFQPDLADYEFHGPEGREPTYIDPAQFRPLAVSEDGRLDMALAQALEWLIAREGLQPSDIAVITCRSPVWKVVILAEHDGVGKESPKRRRQLLYVATSRAMHHLVVLGQPSDLLHAVE